MQVATLGAVTTYQNNGLTASTTYSYTVRAFDAAGNVSASSSSASATTQAPAVDTTAPSTPAGLTAAAASSSQINLSWTAATDNVGVTGYNVYRGGLQITTLGAVTTFQNTGLTASTTYAYTVQAFDAAGNASGQSIAASATTVSPPVPTVSLAANPTSVAGGGSSTLTWSSTNTTACTASGGWSGTRAPSGGNEPTGALTASANYSLICTGSGGSASASATVTVSGTPPPPPPPPVPTVSLTANPMSVANGASSTLTWSSTNATSCTASGAWSGAKATSGNQPTGALTASGNYTLACTGSGGSASASATVTVTTGAPNYTTNFDLTEDPISEGGVWRRASNAWTNVRTANGIAFGTNGTANTYDDSYALLSGFGPDQQAEAVVFRSPSLATGVTHEVELLLRMSDDANNVRGYECLFNYFGGVQIVRWNGALGDFTVLPTSDVGRLGRELVSGDVIKATIVGNVISAYINGVLIAQAIDSTFVSGQPGIGFFTRPGGNSAHLGLTSYTVSSN